MDILGFIERNKFSLIGVFSAYAFIFIWSNWVIIETAVPQPPPNDEVVAYLDFSEEEIQEEQPENQEMNPQNMGEMSNVAANVNQEKTTYTNAFSKSQTDADVWNELKSMEASEFSALKADNPKLIDPKSLEKNEVNPNLVKENAEKNDKAGYGMDVVATAYYKLDNRNALSEKKPSYLCKDEGIVRVTIKVNQKGQVIGTEIDESHTNTNNECLRNAALEYAGKWKFNQDFNDILKKQGWIEFRYQAQ